MRIRSLVVVATLALLAGLRRHGAGPDRRALDVPAVVARSVIDACSVADARSLEARRAHRGWTSRHHRRGDRRPRLHLLDASGDLQATWSGLELELAVIGPEGEVYATGP